MNKTVDYYLSLPYRVELMREDNDTWFARVPDLPGCMTEGETAEEAVELIQDAMALWIEVALEDARTIPEPRPIDEYSGKFVVRMTKSLHRDLAEASNREGVSLNHFVTTELARAVGREVSTATSHRTSDSSTEVAHGATRFDTEESYIQEDETASHLESHCAQIEAALFNQDFAGAQSYITQMDYLLRTNMGLRTGTPWSNRILAIFHDQLSNIQELREGIIQQALGQRVNRYVTRSNRRMEQMVLREEQGEYAVPNLPAQTDYNW